MELDGKVVIVTGAGRGLGRATVLLLLRNGARVAAADVNEEWLDGTVEQARQQGGDVAGIPVDVEDEVSVANLVSEAAAHFGQVDGIVNNAATMVVGKAADVTESAWDRVMDVNARGVFYGCKHAVRHFLAQGTGGAIVNIGSVSALVGLPDQVAYCASKGAVIQLTRQVAVDYAAQSIRCNSVGPGSIEGEFLASYVGGQDDPAAADRKIREAHPMGRLADPAEVAEAVSFLLSDRASFITGANLQVDGGYSAI